MSDFFIPPGHSIQAAIELLMPYTYSQPYMESIGWNIENAEDPLMFDCSMAVVLLGGVLMSRDEFHNIN